MDDFHSMTPTRIQLPHGCSAETWLQRLPPRWPLHRMLPDTWRVDGAGLQLTIRRAGPYLELSGDAPWARALVLSHPAIHDTRIDTTSHTGAPGEATRACLQHMLGTASPAIHSPSPDRPFRFPEVAPLHTRTLASNLTLAEGLRWRRDALYFSDMHAHTVCRLDTRGQLTPIAKLPEPVSGLGWGPNDQLYAVGMWSHRLISVGTHDEQRDMHLRDQGQVRSNDLLMLADGRAWCSSFGFDLFGGEPLRPTRLIHMTPKGSPAPHGPPLLFPNGMFYREEIHVAETPAYQISRVSPDNGLTQARPPAWSVLPGMPDGMTPTSDGGAWVALVHGGTAAWPDVSRFVRVGAAGQVLASLPTSPGWRAIDCAIHRNLLFVSEARHVDPKHCPPGNGRLRVITLPQRLGDSSN